MEGMSRNYIFAYPSPLRRLETETIVGFRKSKFVINSHSWLHFYTFWYLIPCLSYRVNLSVQGIYFMQYAYTFLTHFTLEYCLNRKSLQVSFACWSNFCLQQKLSVRHWDAQVPWVIPFLNPTPSELSHRRKQSSVVLGGTSNHYKHRWLILFWVCYQMFWKSLINNYTETF